MVKPNNQFEAMAGKAAERLQRAKEAGAQLNLLPPEPDAGALVADQPRGHGQRGKGKAVSQLREWLARKGYRMPEDILAEIAGLASGVDAFTTAMARTEQLMLWADAHLTPKGKIDLFLQMFLAQLRAADALMPYGAAKVTADAPPAAPVVIQMPGSHAPLARDGSTARVVGGDRGDDPRGRTRPPPMPWEMQQDQEVSEASDVALDDASRTE